MVQRTTVYNEGIHNAEWLISMADHQRSVDEVAIAQDAEIYMSGTVMMGALDAENERWDGADPATISGILLRHVDAIAGADRGVVVNVDALACEEYLVFDAAVTDPQKAQALEQLRTVGIKTRESSK